MALLEVDDIHAYYGNIHALKGVSLSVDAGEIVTLIGANGAARRRPSTPSWASSGCAPAVRRASRASPAWPRTSW
jgi:hypothetical protein